VAARRPQHTEALAARVYNDPDREEGEGEALKTVITSLVSAVIGGLVATIFVLVGMSLLGDDYGDVNIRQAPAPVEGSPGALEGGADGGSVEEVYNQDGPGVVSVDVSSGGGGSSGSGFVLDENGHIVTNQHVVDGADRVSVSFSGGERMTAEVVGEDASTDVAVLRAEAPEEMLTPLTLGDSEAVDVGEPVIAIGNPLDVGTSATTGIVSGTGRPIKAPNNYTIDNAIQTDAAINPGSSGGPLLDARGTVIGVNSQIQSSTGSFQGVGFAVPINTVKGVVEQLITTGEVEHGYIGVQMFDVGVAELASYAGTTPERLAEEYEIPESGAIVVETTGGGPAAEAGISGGDEEEEIAGLPVPLGDVITGIEGDEVASPEDVISVVNARKPGERIEMTVVSPGGEPRRVEVRLGSRPEES
jgi:S1-C subfamily serine protease